MQQQKGLPTLSADLNNDWATYSTKISGLCYTIYLLQDSEIWT